MPGGVINTGTHPKLLWPGIHAIWGQTYDQHPEEYTDLYEVMDSDQAYEEEIQITPFGLAPLKPEGQAGSYQGEMQGPIVRYLHLPYFLGYIVTYEERRDNKYAVVSERRAKANANSIRHTIETVAASIYNNITATGVFVAGDGLALASASHLNTSGGTYSNLLSPAANFSEPAVEDMLIQIMQAKDDQGNPISLMGQSVHVAPQEYFNANRILKSVLQPDSASNNINVVKAMGLLPKGIKLNHYFTNARRWFVRTNAPEGMKFFWRDRPMFDQDNDFDTKNAKAGTYMRFSVGGTDPRGIYTSAAA